MIITCITYHLGIIDLTWPLLVLDNYRWNNVPSHITINYIFWQWFFHAWTKSILWRFYKRMVISESLLQFMLMNLWHIWVPWNRILLEMKRSRIFFMGCIRSFRQTALQKRLFPWEIDSYMLWIGEGAI